MGLAEIYLASQLPADLARAEARQAKRATMIAAARGWSAEDRSVWFSAHYRSSTDLQSEFYSETAFITHMAAAIARGF